MAILYFICGFLCALFSFSFFVMFLKSAIALFLARSNGQSLFSLLSEGIREREYSSTFVGALVILVPFLASASMCLLTGWGAYELFNLAF